MLNHGEKVVVSYVLKEALSVSKSMVEALVSALQKMKPAEIPQCNVHIGKKDVIIPSGHIHEVKCRI